MRFLGVDLFWPSVIDAAILLLASLIVGISFWISTISSEFHWFARSGSLMVLLAVVVEFRNLNLQQLLNDNSARISRNVSGILRPTKQPYFRQVLINVAHILVVIGTIIWGYGDLLAIES